MMKALMKLALLVLMGLTICLGGCQYLGVNKEEQVRKISRVAEINRRMLADDFEAITMFDRPSSLSRWLVSTE